MNKNTVEDEIDLISASNLFQSYGTSNFKYQTPKDFFEIGDRKTRIGSMEIIHTLLLLACWCQRMVL